MLNKKNDYFNAIKTKFSNQKLLIINVIFLTLLGYITFSYLKTESTQTPVLKKAVLGVSQTIDQPKADNEKLMKVLVSEPTIRSQSSYTEAIEAVELDDRLRGFKGKIAVVNEKEKNF